MSSNTKQHGALRFFTYLDVAQDTYVGICVEAGIVKESKNAEELRQELLEAAVGYVEAVIKGDLSDELLNQRVPEEYENIYKAFLESLIMGQHKRAMPSGIQHPSVFAERVPV